MKGDSLSLRKITITYLLQYLIYLQPLNFFLYTWRFLRELEEEAKNSVTKKIIRWYARITIVLAPFFTLFIVTVYIVATSRALYYRVHLDTKEYQFYEQVSST